MSNKHDRFVAAIESEPRFIHVEPCGNGSYGSVFKCVDQKFEKFLVAVKVQSLGDGQRELAALESFEKEAEDDPSLGNHLVLPLGHIVRVPTGPASLKKAHLFIMMPLAECSLHNMHDTHAYEGSFGFSTLSERRAVAATTAVLRALISAHNLGWTHNDVKSDNVLAYRELQSDGACVYRYKLTDWSHASRWREDPDCKANHRIAPPEVLQTYDPHTRCFRASSPQADLFSAMLMLFSAVTGVRPYTVEEDDSMEDILVKQRGGLRAAAQATLMNSGVPGSLVYCITMGLSLIPEERGSLEGMVDRLDAISTRLWGDQREHESEDEDDDDDDDDDETEDEDEEDDQLLGVEDTTCAEEACCGEEGSQEELTAVCDAAGAEPSESPLRPSRPVSLPMGLAVQEPAQMAVEEAVAFVSGSLGSLSAEMAVDEGASFSWLFPSECTTAVEASLVNFGSSPASSTSAEMAVEEGASFSWLFPSERTTAVEASLVNVGSSPASSTSAEMAVEEEAALFPWLPSEREAAVDESPSAASCSPPCSSPTSFTGMAVEAVAVCASISDEASCVMVHTCSSSTMTAHPPSRTSSSEEAGSMDACDDCSTRVLAVAHVSPAVVAQPLWDGAGVIGSGLAAYSGRVARGACIVGRTALTLCHTCITRAFIGYL